MIGRNGTPSYEGSDGIQEGEMRVWNKSKKGARNDLTVWNSRRLEIIIEAEGSEE